MQSTHVCGHNHILMERGYLLTRPMVSRRSISGQSSRQSLDLAISFSPIKAPITAKLSPDRVGPPWITECPIILPAIRNRSLSTRAVAREGMRWSVCPSNRRVSAAFPEQSRQNNNTFEQTGVQVHLFRLVPTSLQPIGFVCLVICAHRPVLMKCTNPSSVETHFSTC